MAQNGMHNLATLIKRLEAAAARLEDIADSTQNLPPVIAAGAPATSSSTPVPTAAPTKPAEPVPECVEAYDELVKSSVLKFVEMSKTLNKLVDEQAQTLLEGFRSQRAFLLISTKAKKPDMAGAEMSVFQDLLKPISEAMAQVSAIKEGSNRGSAFYNHLSTVAEGVLVLAWVTVENKPWKHVEDSLGSAQFFGNRVLKEFREKDSKQVEWVQAFYQLFRDLADYVKEYFPNGITWNPKGKPAQDVMNEVKTAAPSTAPAAPPASPAPDAGGPPPPPPGPPPVLQVKEEPAGSSSAPAGGLSSVFSELNKGEAVTKALRKVDKSEMTHKNPSLRASSTVSGREGSTRGKSPAPSKKPKPENMRVKKPPRMELDGNKWMIENYENTTEPIEVKASITHSILISKCNKATIIVKGKANAITIENTQRLSLVIDSLVSSVDAVKSSNFALQVMGVLPTVMLDQIDGATIYFGKESASTRVFTSKSAGVNLNVIAGPDEDYKELPLPSQICSYYDEEKGDVVNEIVNHAG